MNNSQIKRHEIINQSEHGDTYLIELEDGKKFLISYSEWYKYEFSDTLPESNMPDREQTAVFLGDTSEQFRDELPAVVKILIEKMAKKVTREFRGEKRNLIIL